MSRLVLHSTVIAAVAAVLSLSPAVQAADPAGDRAGDSAKPGDSAKTGDSAKAGDSAARVRELLDTVAGAGSSAARLDAAAQVIALGPSAVPALGAHLERERKTTEADRRTVLTAIHAALPDEKGRFARRSKDSKVSRVVRSKTPRPANRWPRPSRGCSSSRACWAAFWVRCSSRVRPTAS